MELNWSEDNTTNLNSELPDFSYSSDTSPAANATGNGRAAGSGWMKTEPLLVMRFICDVWITAPIAVFGIIGNLVSIFVLRKYKPAMTTTLILQCLAWIDTAYLVGSVVLRPFKLIPGYDAYLRFINFWLLPTLYVIRLTDTWLIVLLTVDRFIAVCYPLHASRLCSRARTSLLIGIIVLCSFVFSSPRYFEYTLGVETNHTAPPTNHTAPPTPGPQKSLLQSSWWYMFIYVVFLFSVVMYLVPMTTVTILNTKLLVAFRRSATHRATSLCVNSFTSTHSSSSDRSFSTKASCTSSICSSSNSNSSSAANLCSMTRTVTAVSVTVVLISIATDTVAMLSHSLTAVNYIFPHLTTVAIYRKYMTNLSNVAVTLRCAVNFVVYCAVSRQFRVVLFRSLGCSRLVRGGPPTTTTRGGRKAATTTTGAAGGRHSSSSSSKISTGILSQIIGQRQPLQPGASVAASSAADDKHGGGPENGFCVKAKPFNQALVSFFKR